MTQNAKAIEIFLQNCKRMEMEIFSPIKIWTWSAPQNDCLNLSFVERKFAKKRGQKWRFV